MAMRWSISLKMGRMTPWSLPLAHRQFREMDSAAIRALGKPDALLYDIKGVLPKSESDWRL